MGDAGDSSSGSTAVGRESGLGIVTVMPRSFLLDTTTSHRHHDKATADHTMDATLSACK